MIHVAFVTMGLYEFPVKQIQDEFLKQRVWGVSAVVFYNRSTSKKLLETH